MEGNKLIKSKTEQLEFKLSSVKRTQANSLSLIQ